MRVLANNCVSIIECPKEARCGDGVAYNPVLGLFVTKNVYVGVSAWNPASGKVINVTDYGPDGCIDMLLLPDNHIAISYSEGNHGGMVQIYSLEKEIFDSPEPPELKLEPRLTYPRVLSLTPQKSILVNAAWDDGYRFDEILIDWDNLKVLKNRSHYIDPEIVIDLLCYSPDRKVIIGGYQYDEDDGARKDVSSISIYFHCKRTDQGNREEEEEIVYEEADIQKEATITYYMLDGEENRINNVQDFLHDGQNLIIADGDKIVLLESLTEGTKAQLIVSGLKPAEQDQQRNGMMNLNHKGQLMVCHDKVSIKVFDYKCNPRSLQDLCRCCILETIPIDYSDKVKNLRLPSTMKDYLLYK